MPEKESLDLIGRKLTKQELKDLLRDAIEEEDKSKKGSKLERFLENLIAQEEGFVFIRKHCRSEVGEIDYFYRSEHNDHPLWKNYQYVFIECKNWKDKIGSAEVDHFIRLMKAKTFLNCCGVYLTTSPLSDEAFTTIRDARMSEKLLIIPIESTDLTELVEKGFKTHMQDACDKILAKA